MTYLHFSGPVILVPTIRDDIQKAYRYLHRPDYQIWRRRRNVSHSWQRMEVE